MSNPSNAPRRGCDHIIGLLRHTDYSELVNLDRLIKHINNQNEWNEMLRNDPCFIDLQFFLKPNYTLMHYGDLRTNTDLTRFKFCPTCGTAIDWKAIRNTDS